MSAYRDEVLPRRSVDDLVKLAAMVGLSIEVARYSLDEIETLLHRICRGPGGGFVGPSGPRLILRGTSRLPMEALERLALIGEGRVSGCALGRFVS